jgi:cytidine deaminase
MSVSSSVPARPLRKPLSHERKLELLAQAAIAAKNSYSPYSKYPVGAALLTESGDVVLGANIENASFGLTCCAERTAVFAAAAMGHRRFTAIAIVTRDGGVPCGACRQVLREFAHTLPIIMGNLDGSFVQESSLDVILPMSFGPENLDA